MTRHIGGEEVTKGTYLHLATGQFVQIVEEGAMLPETASTKYVKVPLALVFIAGPLIGLAYIIFLPLAGIGSVFILVAFKVRGWTRERARPSTEG
jgi:hypothetical protein